jgi:hypothetical protein
MNKEHELKTWTNSFQAVWDGKKKFEYRNNDRDFKLAEYLLLKEWNTDTGYTGRALRVQIASIWTSNDIPSLTKDYVIMDIHIMGRITY